MKPEPKRFTKDNPVRKTDIWRCFRKSDSFRSVQVDMAYHLIGKNAPRYMEKKGYLVRENQARGDYYTLTSSGEEWLTKGIIAHLKNHPADKSLITELPQDRPARRVRRRR